MTIYESLYDRHREVLRNEKVIPQNNFYHYTSPAGLKGIIESKKIWFSNIEYLNDEQELFYTYNLVKKITEEIQVDNYSDFLKGVFDQYDKYIQTRKREHVSSDYYIACFSNSEDNLSLWHYYTKNENSIGYNIEFSKNLIERLLHENTYNLDTSRIIHGQVIYNVERQRELIKNAINDFNDAYLNSNDLQVQNNIALFFWYLVNDFSLFFKHKAFKAEKEYRIILPKGKLNNRVELKSREYNGFFIPYIERLFDVEDIKSIKLSPTNKETLVKESVINLLKMNNYNANIIKVEKSDIPLRY